MQQYFKIALNILATTDTKPLNLWGKNTWFAFFFTLNNYVPDTLFKYQANKIIVKAEQLTGGPGRPWSPVKPLCPFWPLSPRSPLSPLSPRGPWGPCKYQWWNIKFWTGKKTPTSKPPHLLLDTALRPPSLLKLERWWWDSSKNLNFLPKNKQIIIENCAVLKYSCRIFTLLSYIIQ